MQKPDISQRIALKFVILMGFISLFADVTYEGARSITGPYLAELGASALLVGFVAGFGELLGYGLRLFSGFLLDKTGRYWLIAIIGYVVNLLAVPLLALTHHVPTAAALIIAERVGKAIRVPARDAMLSHASQRMGMGWGFGVHEAMDQIGAMSGPLLITIVLFFQNSYRIGFATLFIPALIALMILIIAAKLYPEPQNLEVKIPEFKTEGVNRLFWFYIIGAAFVAAGYADFPLIAYHFQKTSLIPAIGIPLSYALAMAVSAIAALLCGRWYDYLGYKVLVSAIFLSSLFAPCVFLGGERLAFFGMMLWGIGMGAQLSVLKAVVGNMVSKEKRGSAYGVFNAVYGIAWFLGSVLMGYLYGVSITSLVIFSVVAQLLAIPFFVMVEKKL